MSKISWRWWIWFALIAAANLRLFFVNVSPFMINGEWYFYDHMTHRFLEWAATTVLSALIWGLLPYLWAAKRRAKKEAT
jgi:hypothetical protein